MDIYDLIESSEFDNGIAIESHFADIKQANVNEEKEMMKVYTINNMVAAGADIIKNKEKYLASNDKARAAFSSVIKQVRDGTIPGIVIVPKTVNGIMIAEVYKDSKLYKNFIEIEYFLDKPKQKKLTMKVMKLNSLKTAYKKVLREKFKNANESNTFFSDEEIAYVIESAINVIQEGLEAK